MAVKRKTEKIRGPVGEAIFSLRHEVLGISQAELSRRIKLTTVSINKHENGGPVSAANARQYIDLAWDIPEAKELLRVLMEPIATEAGFTIDSAMAAEEATRKHRAEGVKAEKKRRFRVI